MTQSRLPYATVGQLTVSESTEAPTPQPSASQATDATDATNAETETDVFSENPDDAEPFHQVSHLLDLFKKCSKKQHALWNKDYHTDWLRYWRSRCQDKREKLRAFNQIDWHIAGSGKRSEVYSHFHQAMHLKEWEPKFLCVGCNFAYRHGAAGKLKGSSTGTLAKHKCKKGGKEIRQQILASDFVAGGRVSISVAVFTALDNTESLTCFFFREFRYIPTKLFSNNSLVPCFLQTYPSVQ